MSDTVINSNNYNKLAALKLSQASKKTDQADSTSTRDFSSLFQNAASTITNTLSGGNLEDIFKRAAAQYKIPESLLKAVAKVESGNDASAVSSCGAQGVMQLMPSTAASLGVQDPLNAEQNIMGGAKYLSQMLTRYNGNPQLALAAYNAGEGAVSRYNWIPPYPETQNYVYQVAKRYGQARRASVVAAAKAEKQPERETKEVAPVEKGPEYAPIVQYVDADGRLHMRTN